MQTLNRNRNQVSDILKRNQLSVTGSRKTILGLFLSTKRALAHADIEKKAAERIDRVTVYRTLQSFMEKGIIHTIPTADNSIRYALCKDDCSEGHHHDNHVHFLCRECSRTTCLESVIVPEVKLPRGFQPIERQMIVTGICVECLT
jgi:Fur family ferric uptake transcriptional regulator